MLRQQTLHGIRTILDPSAREEHHARACQHRHAQHERPHSPGCPHHKSETSRFIDRISSYMNEGAMSDGSTVRARSSTASSRAGRASETDEALVANRCKMQSTSTMKTTSTLNTGLSTMNTGPSTFRTEPSTVKTRSSKASTAETLEHEVDEFLTSNTLTFPSCYHPVTSIGFQCKELKLYMDKSSVAYKIVSGIEYNLGRLSVDMLDPKMKGDLPGMNKNANKQAGKIKDLKALCKSLKEEKQSLQDALDAQTEATLASKKREADLAQENHEFRNKLEETIKKTEEYCKALSSSAQLLTELQEEVKVVPLLRQMQAKLNDRMETVVRENEMLKLDTHKLRLERESFKTLLQSKDVEINRFKDEIVEVHRHAADQFSKLRVLNHKHRLTCLAATMPHYSPHSRSEPGTPDGSLLAGEPYIGRTVWDGGGESDEFPACSSPSSERSEMTLGPYPSWEKISPITSDLNQERSKERTPPPSHVRFLRFDPTTILEEVEEGPYDMTDESMQRQEFVRMHTDSERVATSTEPSASDNGATVVPSLPKPTPFIDLMPPPSELSIWSDALSAEEVGLIRVHDKDEKPKEATPE